MTKETREKLRDIYEIENEWEAKETILIVESVPLLLDSLDAAEKRVVELESQNCWLPVDGVPEQVEVLLTDGTHVASGHRYRCYWNLCPGADMIPTHYLPLPKLPE